MPYTNGPRTSKRSGCCRFLRAYLVRRSSQGGRSSGWIDVLRIPPLLRSGRDWLFQGDGIDLSTTPEPRPFRHSAGWRLQHHQPRALSERASCQFRSARSTRQGCVGRRRRTRLSISSRAADRNCAAQSSNTAATARRFAGVHPPTNPANRGSNQALTFPVMISLLYMVGGTNTAPPQELPWWTWIILPVFILLGLGLNHHLYRPRR